MRRPSTYDQIASKCVLMVMFMCMLAITSFHQVFYTDRLMAEVSSMATTKSGDAPTNTITSAVAEPTSTLSIEESVERERPENRRRIPLKELTRSDETWECPPGQVFVPDTVLEDPSSVWDYPGRSQKMQIPKIIHVTAANRCMAPEFAEVLDSWRLPGYSLFFHDDQAMDRLLNKYWVEFPGLHNSIRCVLYGGAMKADIWRTLVAWEYGGIYTDIDNRPHKFNATTLTPDDQGLFQIEQNGCPSQWFFAMKPRHPMMYQTIHHLSRNLETMEDTGKPKIVWVTGPGVMCNGFQSWSKHPGKGGKNWPPGVYFEGNKDNAKHTINIVGTGKNESEWVHRAVWNFKVKHEIMQRSNMTHLLHFGLKENEISCMKHMYEADKGTKNDDGSDRAAYW